MGEWVDSTDIVTEKNIKRNFNLQRQRRISGSKKDLIGITEHKIIGKTYWRRYTWVTAGNDEESA